MNLEVFCDGWVIATKEQSYRSHSGKLEKPFIWLRFLHFAALQSKWQRSYLYLEYRIKIQEAGLLMLNAEFWMTFHVQQLLNFQTLNFQTFYSKTDFSIHQIFPLLSKIWYSKWPLWNFFECWIRVLITTFEPWSI